MKQTLLQGIAKIPAHYKKLTVGLLLTVIILIPEEAANTFAELSHLGFEGISFILEEFIQHVFHVDKYLSQCIVFYLWLSAAAAACYFLWRTLPSLLKRLKSHLFATWMSCSTALADYWQSLTLTRKTVFVVIYTGGLYLIFSFFI
ncbi:MAG: hypothetical protein ACU85E_11740 [Gammaproteobacteria bacterium]